MTPALTTPVTLPTYEWRLKMDDSIVSMGSCFADEIGRHLSDSGFRIENNPFGTLYNPASIAMNLQRLIDDIEIVPSDLVEHEGLWHSWHHHGAFSQPSPNDTLAVCNHRLHTAHQALAEARLLLVTFGTAWVFERAQQAGSVVANCHKLPASCFVRRRMTVDEVVQMWQPLLGRLAAFNPRLRVMFTVSPIRHLADGAHGNQLSKSTLLLSVDRLCETSPSGTSCHYFPAYEIVLDELRDYRFYAADMTHPSPLAVDIVWDRFQQATMDTALQQVAHNNTKQAKRSRHVPLHPAAHAGE